MSTYYYLYCRRCKEYCDFVGRWFPWRWGFMAGADKKIPWFIAKHSNHLEELEIISEHDDRWYDATEFTMGAEEK